MLALCFGERKDKEVRSQMGLGETWLGLCTAMVMAVVCPLPCQRTALTQVGYLN